LVRRFVVIGQKATASDDFLLDDLPGTSGRLDVLVRSLRPALLTSHGLRRDVVVYLVLLGGPRAPRVVRVDGAAVRFLRPDERSLAVLLKKVLATTVDDMAAGFAPARPGIAVARVVDPMDLILADAPGARLFVLDERGDDIRDVLLDVGRAKQADQDELFVIGDHLGLPDAIVRRLHEAGARRVQVGPTSIHADDVVAVVTNELDRRGDISGLPPSF
jgi:tRNA (pseudouridine54-N1)-methyltransferase